MARVGGVFWVKLDREDDIILINITITVIWMMKVKVVIENTDKDDIENVY